LSLALWWGDSPATLSMLISPRRIKAEAERVAAEVKQLAAIRHSGTAAPFPRLQPGTFRDWEGEWKTPGRRWGAQLKKSMQDSGGKVRELELSLEQREMLLCDHRGTTRHILRHATRLTIACTGGTKERGSWTFTVPFDTPAPCDPATAHRAWDASRTLAWMPAQGKRGSRSRYARTDRSGAANQYVPCSEPDAAADDISLFKSTRPGHPSDEVDDLGYLLSSFEAKSAPRPLWFDHLRALPRGFPEHVWVPPGALTPREIKRGGDLIIRHFDELLKTGPDDSFATIASGEIRMTRIHRAVSGIRLKIPSRRLREALPDAGRKGRSLLSIHFGGVSYHVPTISLGELSWKPP